MNDSKAMFCALNDTSNVGLQKKKNEIYKDTKLGFLRCQISASALDHT